MKNCLNSALNAKEEVCQMIYDRQRYEIPHSEMGSWLAYVRDLSYFVLDAGNTQIAFTDKFSKYLKKIKNE